MLRLEGSSLNVEVDVAPPETGVDSSVPAMAIGIHHFGRLDEGYSLGTSLLHAHVCGLMDEIESRSVAMKFMKAYSLSVVLQVGAETLDSCSVLLLQGFFKGSSLNVLG